MTKFSSRAIEIFDLPIPTEVRILHPDRAVLRYFKSHSIDFGALCYLRRRSDGRRKSGQGRQVDLTSFSAERASQVRTLIEFVSGLVDAGRQGRHSLDTIHRNIIKFMDWCDSSGHSDALADEAAARRAFRAYVEHLRRLVAQHRLNNNTAVVYQNHCRDTLEPLLNIDRVDRGVNTLTKSGVFDTPTPVPSDDAQGKVIAWCQSIFSGLSELVVGQRPYPFSMSVPEYMNWPHNRLWIFPGLQWCKPPGAAYKRRNGPVDFIAYDHSGGRIHDLETLEAEYASKSTPRKLKRLWVNAHQVVAAANQNFRSRDRIERAILAVKAFAILFVANTGMNPAQALSLPWSPELDNALANPLIERQGFRTIKYRANNKTVWFEIGVQFMTHFRRYLELRRYLLAGSEFNSLFFGFSPADLNKPVARSTDIFANTFRILNRFDPALPKVMPRKWRAAKQDHLIRNHDPHVAARVMQHSVITALRKYSNGSESTHQVEIGEFLSHVETVVIQKGQTIEHGEIRSIGICSAPNHPTPITGHVPVQPDCKGPEGCLFCDQYRVHANETDTRKLLSCRHCIRKISHLANSREQFERMFGVVLNRIGFILDEISRRDGHLVERIEHEVDIDGELDPYWAIKLETLMELDLA